ncbi:hypothetical protein [Erwinia tracheiphila]|nr:hypothetical protein [Erwinia tracheiphila]
MRKKRGFDWQWAGKTVYTVSLRPKGPFNAEYQLAESGEADVKA